MKHIKIVLLFALFLAGCASPQRRLTESEWLKRMPPPDTVEKGKAMGVLQAEIKKAEAKVQAAKSLDKVKIACVVGAVLSFIAIFLGAVKFGVPIAAGCICGWALIEANIRFPYWFSVLGLTGGICLCGYQIWLKVKTAQYAVGYGQEAKKFMADSSKNILKTWAEKKQKQPKAVQKEIVKIKEALK